MIILMMAYITPDYNCATGVGVSGSCNYINGATAAPIIHMTVLGFFVILSAQTLSIFTNDRAPALVRSTFLKLAIVCLGNSKSLL